jgi:4-amino-4-deoxy-L-arabinose transferase-like glycosyltransferase
LQRSTLAKRAWLLFLLVAAACYFYGLGRLPLIGPDEPRYAEVAREMFLRHDLVTPTLGGHPWFEKPALLYWMVMAAFGAFGVSEWAARAGMALAGLSTSLVIYWLGLRVERADEPREMRGLAAGSAIALASSAGMLGFSRGVNFDIILNWTLTAALACFFVAEVTRDEKRRRWLRAAVYVAVGAALLAKGLVGVVLPLGIIIAYFLLRREWPGRETRLSLLWGIPRALLVAAVWYVPVTLKHGWPFIDQFFIQHHFQRFVTNKYHHPHAVYYYLPIMLLLAFPWTAFLVTALAGREQRGLRAQTVGARLRAFALSWLIVPVLFFTFSQSKLPGYVLPALPGAALLIGNQLARFLRGEGSKLAMRATGAMLLLLGLGEAIYVMRTAYLSTTCAIIIAAPLVIAGALVVCLAHARRQLCILLTACAMFVALALTINCAARRVGDSESARTLLEQATARGYASAPIYHMYAMDYTTTYYAADRLAYGADGEPIRYEGAAQVADEAERLGRPILVLVHSGYAGQLTEYKRIQTEVIGDNGTVALVAVRPR